MAIDGTVSRTLTGHVYEIEIDRAEKLNSFTPAMFEQYAEALGELEGREDAWVGVVTFAGEHTTAGLDLSRFNEYFQRGFDRPERPDPFAINRRCEKPLVMALQGFCYTIGIELALAADIVVASVDTCFAQLEPKRGLAVLGGAQVRYVERAGWGNAMYHLLRGDRFTAERAERLGIVQEVVMAGEQKERAMALARQICECSPVAVREMKRAADLYLRQGQEVAFSAIPAMRDRVLASEDFAEGVASFVERRKARFTGR